jgi:HAD superfamily hydrolase (TIGR01509 family)
LNRSKTIPVKSGIEGLIFDCDGTLADTMPLHLQAWCRTFEDYGLECPESLIYQLTGMPAEKIVDVYNRRYGTKLDAPRFGREKNQRAQALLSEARPIRPVVAIAEAHRGKMPMAVASGGSRPNVTTTLQALGIIDWFSAVITSDEAVAPKPDPAIFIEAARRLGVVPQKCQVFEDGDVGLEAARRAGMAVVDVRSYIASARE